MKQFLLLTILIVSCFYADAQLVQCRPRIAMPYYWYHDDSSPNSTMTTIINFKPEILIDNTKSSLWKGATIPSKYQIHGIKVYSYITGGYEGTSRGGDTATLSANLTRIDAIASVDGSDGVFLDEVSNFPTPADTLYIDAIYKRCKANNLKLILNPGTKNFHPWLMDHCDFLVSDEHYSAGRKPVASEIPFLDRIIVLSLGVTNATDAANNSLRARDQGFGYSWSTFEYTSFTSWVSTYQAYITNMKTATPAIAKHGAYLVSTAPVGNQWYNSGLLMPGKTDDTLTLDTSGIFYSIVTLDNCVSDSSNHIVYTARPTITKQGLYLVSNTSIGNQWYNSGVLMPGKTDDTLTLDTSGVFYTIVTLNNYASDSSNHIAYTKPTNGINSIDTRDNFLIYPNPAKDYITIHGERFADNNLTVKIYNSMGQQVMQKTGFKAGDRIQTELLQSGCYLIIVNDQRSVFRQPFLIQK